MLDVRFKLEVEGIEGIPLYDGDVEAASGVPPRAQAAQGLGSPRPQQL
jgi:hypothetical protein